MANQSQIWNNIAWTCHLILPSWKISIFLVFSWHFTLQVLRDLGRNSEAKAEKLKVKRIHIYNCLKELRTFKNWFWLRFRRTTIENWWQGLDTVHLWTYGSIWLTTDGLKFFCEKALDSNPCVPVYVWSCHSKCTMASPKIYFAHVIFHLWIFTQRSQLLKPNLQIFIF